MDARKAGFWVGVLVVCLPVLWIFLGAFFKWLWELLVDYFKMLEEMAGIIDGLNVFTVDHLLQNLGYLT
ncbi:MAG: hypothetical protein HWN66_03880 [Candidatus Helarchaeota archaeon]|nr:hypothetical protein [Candidatus Helarchaeota archaeon]